MDDYDKVAARRLQYGPSEGVAEDDYSGFRPRRAVQADSLEFKGRSSVIHLGDKNFETPSMQYVQQIERVLLAMGRRMRQMEMHNRQLKATVQKQATELREVWSALDRKLDGR